MSLQNGGVQVELPPPALGSPEGRVKAEADIGGALLELLGAQCSDLDGVCELSGGFDSSCTTIAARHAGASYGLIFSGIPGAQQQRRRQEIVNLRGLQDHAFYLDDFDVDSWITSIPGKDPTLDLYAPATDWALKSMGVASQLVITGIGGDEVFDPTVHDSLQVAESAPGGRHESTWDDAPESFPKTEFPETALLASTSRFEVFAENDLWAFSPYVTPDLNTFGQRLPRTLKTQRWTQKQALSKAGVSESALQRNLPENFSVLLHSLQDMVRGHSTFRLVDQFLEEVWKDELALSTNSPSLPSRISRLRGWQLMEFCTINMIRFDD